MNNELPEFVLESYIADNLQELFGDDATLVDRQVRLRSGRIPDIVFTQNGALVVVEVKAKRIDRNSVCQLLEYMGEVTGFYCPPESSPYDVRGVLAAPNITKRAATMLAGLPSVLFLEMTARLEVEVNLVTRWGLLAGHDIDVTPVGDILPDDNDVATAIRLAADEAASRARDSFADYLLSSYLFFYKDGNLYSNWRPHPSMPPDQAADYLSVVERKLRLEYPGSNTRPVLAP